MQRKQNESELGAMFRRYHFHTRKSRDRGYVSCPNCHRPVKVCPYCQKDMLLNKAETLPDFIVSWRFVYVEGKGAEDRWDFTTSITPTQRRVMAEDGVDGWLFLEIGTGRAPNGREAYLVPWDFWCKTEELLEEHAVKSIIFEGGSRSKNPTAKQCFPTYDLKWKGGGWIIPAGHPFWITYPDAFEQARALWVREGEQ